MKTPTFNDFKYLHSIIESNLNKGYYSIDLNFWDNELTKNVETYISIQNLTSLGGNFDIFGYSSIFLSFIILLIGLFLTYIHQIKFRQDFYTN